MEARLWGIRSHKIARISLFVCRRGANEEILTGKHWKKKKEAPPNDPERFPRLKVLWAFIHFAAIIFLHLTVPVLFDDKRFRKFLVPIISRILWSHNWKWVWDDISHTAFDTYGFLPHHMRSSVIIVRVQEQNVLVPSLLVVKGVIFVSTPFLFVFVLHVFFIAFLFLFSFLALRFCRFTFFCFPLFIFLCSPLRAFLVFLLTLFRFLLIK